MDLQYAFTDACEKKLITVYIIPSGYYWDKYFPKVLTKRDKRYIIIS